MNVVSKARYRARLARNPQELARVLALRQRSFRPRDPFDDDSDTFDAVCSHLMIEDLDTGEIGATCRLLLLPGGAAIGQSYSAQHYDLTALSSYPGPMMEIGRFCLAPGRRDPDVLRITWGALTRLVDGAGAALLFGCSSFLGASVDLHRDALALLATEHRAPEKWRPGPKAAHRYDFADMPTGLADPRAAQAGLPPLLRSYLSMGGWVSDHAVIDRDLDTLHVFTGLEIAAIPGPRARALRLAASEIDPGDLSAG